MADCILIFLSIQPMKRMVCPENGDVFPFRDDMLSPLRSEDRQKNRHARGLAILATLATTPPRLPSSSVSERIESLGCEHNRSAVTWRSCLRRGEGYDRHVSRAPRTNGRCIARQRFRGEPHDRLQGRSQCIRRSHRLAPAREYTSIYPHDREPREIETVARTYRKSCHEKGEPDHCE